MMTLTFGVIGAGRIGQLHINYLRTHKDVKIKWISDLNCDKMSEWIEKSGIQNKTKDHKDIINDPEVDAIVICSPTDTHVDIIKEASAKGKHIFCEKPISLSLEEAEEAVEAVQKSNIKLQMGFNRRFDKNFKQLQNILSKGELGQIQTLRITSRDPEPPPIEYIKRSGGLFMDMTIHDFDMARYIMQSEIVEVYATGEALVNPEIAEYDDIDTALITLKFENGSIAMIENCRRSVYGYDQRIEILGDHGAIDVGNEQSSTLNYHRTDGIRRDNPPYFFLERYSDAYRVEMDGFIDAILNDTDVLCSIEDGYKAQQIALKCKESLISNQPKRI
ncbi:inositol 2-dehydrogenase [Mammaliicoccus lentus]|uniref:Inositol 2-dehydrogenase n=1 Tax=Mammaliicoccus lentus TaxID=42858 RepID=A0ABS6GZM6_MAMLE|nr:inositol 2-dehydrogenase [Mammaliicoccus lentus]MBF0841233.1 inositol 2-dehydrogenase [Mammaliicoccus lentus]MBU6114097.1 inositol 2-dehydrogenase [Mammaliicoccus lentus]MBW0763462.1 inositol 2-dehydrogenase [Mammaliicoccus lentus]MEB5685942.1 inositol 2-dehydrogenase [Mammaliicoccus lentus]WQL57309.1 inositol 2-dehydrogenase [Mammaliicoccus lentus]